jgi:hypothetical protein
MAIMALPAVAYPAKNSAAAPPEPSLEEATDEWWYIVSSEEGGDFYVLTPYYSAETTDHNLYVNGTVMANTLQFVWVMFLQIDCGHKRYREINSELVMDLRDEESTLVPPKSYGWQRFKKDSVLLEVGRAMCERAAGDRGLEWTWNRH